MRLELSATKPEPIRNILNTLERRLRQMNITELKYFNCYILKGDSTHIEFKIGKKDRVPYDPTQDNDEGNPAIENF